MTFKCSRRLQFSTAWKRISKALKRLKTGLNAQTTAHWLVKKAARPRFPLEPTLLRTGCTQVRVLGLSPTRTFPCLNKNSKVGRERERRWLWIRPGASGGAGWPPEFSSLLCWLSKTPAELVVSGAGAVVV
jgi:hypothetical protein